MYIDNSRVSFRPSAHKQSKSPKNLGKPELISDLFNNRFDPNAPIQDTKICLSYTVQAMLKEFIVRVQNFLSKERKIAKALNEIELPETTYTTVPKNSDLTLRKLKSYLQWLAIHQEEPPTEESTQKTRPFIEIHKEGKNSKIKELFSNLENYHQEILVQREKNTPNYFYLNNPETYAFN